MKSLTGTGRMLRLALRRDRITLSAWVLVLAALLAAFTSMSAANLQTERDIVAETQFMAGSPAMRLMSLSAGASVGAYTMSRSYVTLAILAAVMSILAVTRHTRQNEETGRAELLGVGVAGRSAGMAAAVIVTLAADVALALVLGLAMIAVGQPIESSFAAGAAIGAVGVAFAGIAAVTSQLSWTARGANGLAVMALAIAFGLSAVGNMLGGVDGSGTVAFSAWPSWLSPLGWGYEMRPFGGERWWPLGLFGIFAVVSLAAAGRLAARRDLGQGVLRQRTGRAAASKRLLRPLGLTWRLQRPALRAWLVAMVGFGLIFGSVSESAQNMEGSARAWYEHMGGTTQMLDAFLTSMMQMAGMAVAVYIVQVLLRMREEEGRGRLEPILAAAVSRPRWAMSYVVNAMLGAGALLVVFAVGMGLTAGHLHGDTAALVRELTGAALAQLPAALVVGSAVIALVALAPRWAVPASWSIVGVCILLGPLFGPTLHLPQVLQDLSPFTHSPRMPAAQVGAFAVVALLAAAVALAAAGIAAFRRRDMAAA